MITQNELFDLSFILSLIRGDISNSVNLCVLDRIIALMNNYNKGILNNNIRVSLCSIKNLDERWFFVKHQNFYTRTVMLKIPYLQVIKYLVFLRDLLKSNKFDQAYDFCDAIHILPELLAVNNGRIPKSFYREYIKSYRKKWKCNIFSINR